MPATAMKSVDALTADGRIVRIRPVTKADTDDLIDMHHGCTASDLRQRFFGTGRGIIPVEVNRLVRLNDADTGAAVVAVDDGALIGVASYDRLPGHPERAEFGLLVTPGHQRHGVGTLLLERLASIAVASGVKELSGQILAGNAPMLTLAKTLAPGAPMPFDHGVIDVVLSTEFDEDINEQIAERERAAAQLSLRPLLEPRSVAVVGASRKGTGIGHEVLRSIVDNDFAGPVYPIHPTAETLAGLPAHQALGTVPEPIDLVIIAVPARAVAQVLHEAGAAGARAAVVVSSGFAECGEDAAQAELVRIARDHDMRLVGPNCLGIVNTDGSVRLQGSFAVDAPSAGGLCLASQSGAVGIAALTQATRTGLGIRSFVSLGNKADVSGNDLLAYWYDDPGCKAVALYLESFGNPRKFARVARAVARRKPVLAVKSGRSESGRRAGSSHTAAAASPDTAVDSLFAQAGVIRTDTLEAMLDTARVLVDQPLPRGRRLGLIGNAGGVNVLAADAGQLVDLDVPAFGPDLERLLGEVAEGAAALANPVDLGAAASARAYTEAIGAIAESGEIDALVVVFAATRTNDIPGNLEAIAAALDAASDLPAAVVVLGLSDVPTALGHRKVPVFDFPEPAVAALARAAEYAHWRSRALGRRPELDVDTDAARELVDRLLAAGDGWQSPVDSAELLGLYGVPVAPTVPVGSAREAAAVARVLGYPVALKAADPNLVHKTEAGGVELDLAGPAEVRTAFRRLARVTGGHDGSVVVQPMVDATVELVAGVTHDPLFGSLVMLGLGGVHTDLLGDRVFRLLPLTDTDAASMWRGLRAAPLLTGYRGTEPVDTDGLVDLLERLGRLAEDVPEIAELDLNPIMASPDGVVAADVKLRLARVGDEPDPVARVLR